ncbi:hypothetical protein SAMN05216474_0350 [Lishizhenia tianjinensis]|uniref:Uncharacterized protein n=1 Tax=Lishizhenia tianjinensis TaxID=477690 RepID=A0A1I6XP25_9FLAO|nr:hypothetical protein [Lishizhenia tianjinensis]SFT40030.1 hypothetical protein SAMN05216474_0350 [Lishizhenia tianjinensis]
MTKKFVHSDKSAKGQRDKNEFLIPDIFTKTSRLIGIDSGREYDYGLICYTGVDLDANVVFEKVTALKKISILRHRGTKKLLTNYLERIKNIRISKSVAIDESFNLVEIKITAANKT